MIAAFFMRLLCFYTKPFSPYMIIQINRCNFVRVVISLNKLFVWLM